MKLELVSHRAQELCESGGGRPGLPVPNSPYALCGRLATLNLNISMSVGALEPCEHAGGGAGLSRSELDGLLLQFVLSNGLSGHCLCDFVPHDC